MNVYLRQAAIELGFNEPISIEPNGTIWLGLDQDRIYLTEKQQTDVTKKADELHANAINVKNSAKNKLKALGLTDDEIKALLGV